MSKTEFVMVPRELLQTIRSFHWTQQDSSDLARAKARAALIELLAQPAEQHQGEPVAWRFQTHAGGRWYLTHFEANARAYEGNGEGGAVEPLFTNPGVADSCAVCQGSGVLPGLSVNTTKCSYCENGWRTIAKAEAELRLADQKERDTLRAQLAERDALLDRVVDHANFWHDHPYAEVVEAIARDYKALSASAEPSAPKCGNCSSSTGQACNENGCGFLEAGNGEPLAWHVGGNGYDRICFEEPCDLPGSPCIQAINDQRQLISLLKRYNFRDEGPSAPKCKCDMRTRLVGDGCSACNPERAAELSALRCGPGNPCAFPVSCGCQVAPVEIDERAAFEIDERAAFEIDERAAFEKEFAAKGRPLTRADYDPDAYGNAFDDGAWTGWRARASMEPPK